MPNVQRDDTGEQEFTNGWSNGVTLKKTRDGYSWTISVAADSGSMDDLDAAVEKAILIDGQLAAKYGGESKKPTAGSMSPAAKRILGSR